MKIDKKKLESVAATMALVQIDINTAKTYFSLEPNGQVEARLVNTLEQLKTTALTLCDKIDDLNSVIELPK